MLLNLQGNEIKTLLNQKRIHVTSAYEFGTTPLATESKVLLSLYFDSTILHTLGE